LRPVRKRKLVDEACGEWGVSIRRACRVFLVDTSTYHYKSRRAGQAGLEQRIKEICQTRVRYGYRRVHVLLRREGWRINQKKTRRVYRELGLQLRNKTPKRRVKAKLRDDRRTATRPNQTWAMDFVHDQLATERKLRVLTIIDYVLTLLAGAGAAPFLPRYGCGRGAGTSRARSGITGHDPGRPRHRVCVTRFGSVGVSTWRHARLLPARKADRQCVHRSLQWSLQGRVFERALVPEPCRRPKKDGGLA
jgi:hypothetical protein